MVATKTNERPGTRAQVKYVRSSAYKAREVLDLIRGKSYAQASEILTFSERGISNTILKCLDSAAANAEHNDSIPAEELFVAACYADEGPTLKRWRPRARGRATRIRKRTCHITIIVARYTPAQLDQMRARDEARGTGGRASNAAEARRRRVAQSRAAAEAKAAEEEHDHDHDGHDHDHEGHDHAAASDTEATDAEVTDGADTDVDAEATEIEATDEAAVASDGDDDQTTEAVTDSEADSADAGDTEASEGEDK
ncbi:MAG: 50S ribosomal protein L22 [Acidimicrobiales bacterium]